MNVPRETSERLNAYAALVRDEATRQNLVSAATLDAFDVRHIADSAQLADVGASKGGEWLDLGSGAGLPGIVLAILGHRIHLVESRRLRHEFLARCIGDLGLAGVATLHPGKLETMPTRRFDVITARAFAPLPKLFDLAHRFSTAATWWVLPKGRGAQSELDAARGSWQGRFTLVPSATDPNAAILVAQEVARRRVR